MVEGDARGQEAITAAEVRLPDNIPEAGRPTNAAAGQQPDGDRDPAAHVDIPHRVLLVGCSGQMDVGKPKIGSKAPCSAWFDQERRLGRTLTECGRSPLPRPSPVQARRRPRSPSWSS